MTTDSLDYQHFRARLLEEKAALAAIDATSKEAAATVTLDQSCVGRLSRMDAMQAQAMSIESEQRRGLRLKMIAAALRRMDAEDYGYCLDCDEPINPLRLDSDPTATLCIECASKREA
jgi:DnaK suppressor protein